MIRLTRLLGIVVLLATTTTRAHIETRLASAQSASSTFEPRGYYMVGRDGGIFSFGGSFYGSAGGIKLNQPIAAMAVTPSGAGYWLVARDGGVFSFGDAAFYGSTGGSKLNQPIVSMAATPSGRGYWLFASDGGVFNFGDAGFFGSAGSQKLSSPIVSMSRTPAGNGYWMVASDGGVFSFGDAKSYGSTSGMKIAAPIVGMASTPSGNGYWLVASDGGIFSFGDAPFRGSTGTTPINQPIVAMSPSPTGSGYWLVASDGGVFSFGDATYHGSMGGQSLASPMVGIAALPRSRTAETSAFFYPWYASVSHDGGWRHWDQGGHNPPDDIGANFYPVRGAYSSSDTSVLNSQMAEIKAAGIDTIVTSWWGRGSYEDTVLPKVINSARNFGIKTAIHVEPAGARDDGSLYNDFQYFVGLGVKEIYVYYSQQGLTVNGMRAANDSLPGSVRTWAETGSASTFLDDTFAARASSAHFTGIYTYDTYYFSPGQLAKVCGAAHMYRLLCSPSVGPGWEESRAQAGTRFRERANGNVYDSYWNSANLAQPDVVSITSYNEWHEGTQIEPVKAKCLTDFCYATYDGAFGLSGTAAQTAYMDRTKYWTDIYRAFTK